MWVGTPSGLAVYRIEQGVVSSVLVVLVSTYYFRKKRRWRRGCCSKLTCVRKRHASLNVAMTYSVVGLHLTTRATKRD